MTVDETVAKQRSGVADIREDDEQARKFDDIVKLLVAAGYFRARIKALSQFDRVVGGITWAISFSDVDIDVDLDVLFQENSNIGTKIALTEKIVRVLRLMKCPILLEPHQLQGLDFKSIFPAVQWLVRNAVDTRHHLAGFMAKQADFQRQKVFGFDKHPRKSAETASTVENAYPPNRRFRHADPKAVRQEELRVSVTLMEYGDSSSLIGEAQKEAVEQQQERVEDEQKQQILGQMAAYSARKSATTGAVRHALQDAGEDLKQLAAARREALETANREREEKLSAPRQIEMLSENIEETNKKMLEACEQRDNLLAELADPKKRRDGNWEKVSSLRQRISEFNELWMGEHKETIEKLANLIDEKTNLEKLEKESKATWRAEHDALLASINEAEATIAAGERFGGDQLVNLRESVDVAEKKLSNARLGLAKRARLVAELSRKLDDMPSRAELAQYQRRFVELFDQIAELHRQTKLLYQRYNTVEDTRLVVSRELDLLNSLIQAYPNAYRSPTSTNNSAALELLRQIDVAAQSVSDSKSKAERRKRMAADSLLKAEQQLARHLEAQRTCSKLLAEFADECNRQGYA